MDMRRRRFIKATGVLGATAGIAGCIGGGDGEDGSGDGGDGSGDGGDGSGDGGDGSGDGGDGGSDMMFGDGEFTFIMSPSEPQDLMMSQYKPVKEHLESSIDGVEKVNLKYAQSYSAVIRALGSNTAQVAEMGPFASALGVRAGDVEIVLQRYAFGSWTYKSVIVTREDTDIQSIEDLEGKKIAFADRLSTSGSLFPLFMLKEAGLSIGEAPVNDNGADFEATWSSHGTAFETLMNEQADAAGVGRFITLNDQREYKEGVREVASEGGIPRAPICVSPEISDEAQSAIVDAFENAPDSMYLGADGEEDPDGDENPDDLWFSDVRAADKETFTPVLDVARELNIETSLLDEQSG